MLRRRTVPASLDELLDAAAAGEPAGLPTAGGPSPEQAAMEAETRSRVVGVLAGLPDRYRTAVLLKDGFGLTAEQVAAAMGVSVPAVRSVLHRARAALRAALTAPES
jgi:RNA polymerase sigma factor (sigma-70 family)